MLKIFLVFSSLDFDPSSLDFYISEGFTKSGIKLWNSPIFQMLSQLDSRVGRLEKQLEMALNRCHTDFGFLLA